MLKFEYDDHKSQSNLNKHGIDFIEAQQLWNDDDLIEIPANTDNEQRFVVIAKLKRKHWTAVITYRGDKIRIISVRRARKEEVTYYES
jgi:hypothetical protein